MLGAREPQELFGLTVDPTYFRLFGARPEVGRLFGSEAAVVGVTPTVVLGHGLWQRTFGADPAVVGSTILLGGQAATVVGVIDPAFRPLDENTDFWIPLVNDRDNFSDYQGTAQVNAVARLGDGVTLEQARS